MSPRINGAPPSQKGAFSEKKGITREIVATLKSAHSGPCASVRSFDQSVLNKNPIQEISHRFLDTSGRLSSDRSPEFKSKTFFFSSKTWFGRVISRSLAAEDLPEQVQLAEHGPVS